MFISQNQGTKRERPGVMKEVETDSFDLFLTNVRVLYIISSHTNSSHTNNYDCRKEEIMNNELQNNELQNDELKNDELKNNELKNKELKNKERHIGYEVRTLDNMIGRRVNCWHSKMDEEVGITRMQAWIIGYVYEHSEKPVFQKDLEENFQIARSTATGILQLMEKKDLIVRKPYPGDARLKRLELTARAEKYKHGIMHHFDLLQIALKKDIPQEKLDTFFQVVDMIKNNIEKEDFHDKNIIESGKGV